MVQLAALALNPPTFDPVRATLAGIQAAGSQIQNATALQGLQQAQRRQGTLEQFRAAGGIANPQALNTLSGDPELYTSALQALTTRQAWSTQQGAMAARRVLGTGSEVSPERRRAYDAELTRGLQEGWLTPQQHSQLQSQPPTDLFLQSVARQGQALPTELEAAQMDEVRARTAALLEKQRQRSAFGSWLFGGGGAAVPSAPAAAPPQPSGALGPVTPRSVRLLPVEDGGAVGVPPPPAAAPQPAAPGLAPRTPDARAYPGTIFSGANAVANWMRGLMPPSSQTPVQQPSPVVSQQTAPPEQPLPPASAPNQPISDDDRLYRRSDGTGIVWVDGALGESRAATPDELAAGRRLPQQTPTVQPQSSFGDSMPFAAPVTEPQVRGWLGSGEEPDFVGTPMARGSSAPVPAAQPATQQTTPQPPAVGQFRGVIGALPPDQQRAAVMLYFADDWAGLAKLLEGSEGAARTAAATERGKALGTAQAALPQAVQSGVSMIRNIDAVIDDPYLGYVTGMQTAFNPLSLLPQSWQPTTPWGADTMSRIGQLQGQSFLQAYQALRGAGQISEAEGKKAQEAVARLSNLGQSDAGYLEALNDARFEIWDMMNLARRRAGEQPIPYMPHSTDRKRLPRIRGDQDWANLSSGMPYIDPEGNVKVKR